MKITPEQALEVVKFIGIDAENVDEFKGKFAENWINKSRVEDYARNDEKISKAIIGDLVGKFGDQVTKAANAFGIDTEELKGIDKQQERLAKVIELADKKIKTETETLKSQISGDATKATKEWEEKYTKLEKKFNETTGLLETTKKSFETFQAEVSGKEKQNKIKTYWDENFGKLKFSQTVDELKKEGFIAKFNSKYSIDLDEKGEPFVMDNTTKKRIQSKQNAGNFASAHELLEEEANAFKLLDKTPNTGGNKNYQNPWSSGNSQGQQQQQQNTVRISDRAKRFENEGKL